MIQCTVAERPESWGISQLCQGSKGIWPDPSRSQPGGGTCLSGAPLHLGIFSEVLSDIIDSINRKSPKYENCSKSREIKPQNILPIGTIGACWETLIYDFSIFRPRTSNDRARRDCDGKQLN